MWLKIKGGVLITIGFILSPLSWWNDLIVNLPIAYFVGYLFSNIKQSFFLPTVIITYWLTNIIGVVLMHHGFKNLLNKQNINDNKKQYIKNILFSLAYTILIVILIKLNWLKLPDGFTQMP